MQSICYAIYGRFDWNGWGVIATCILLLGEMIAVGFAVMGLRGYLWGGNIAALTGSTTILLYIAVAVRQGIMPFATLTEYERRRKRVKQRWGILLDRRGDLSSKAIDGRYPPNYASLDDASEESVRHYVARAYVIGDDALQIVSWKSYRPDVQIRVDLALDDISEKVEYHRLSDIIAVTVSPDLLK